MQRKPYFGAIPMFPGNTNLDWIPDAGSQLIISYATEAPNGIVAAPTNTFTFSAAPKVVLYNGDVLEPPNDFTVTGFQAIIPITVPAGSKIYAFI